MHGTFFKKLSDLKYLFNFYWREHIQARDSFFIRCFEHEMFHVKYVRGIILFTVRYITDRIKKNCKRAQTLRYLLLKIIYQRFPAKITDWHAVHISNSTYLTRYIKTRFCEPCRLCLLSENNYMRVNVKINYQYTYNGSKLDYNRSCKYVSFFNCVWTF